MAKYNHLTLLPFNGLIIAQIITLLFGSIGNAKPVTRDQIRSKAVNVGQENEGKGEKSRMGK